MLAAVKKKLIETFPKTWRYWGVFFDRNSYLRINGWFETMRRGYPCRADGTPIPWMNYSVVGLLEDRLTKDLRVFEYGSGYSSIFYGDRTSSVVSIENNEKWFEILRGKVPGNVDLRFVPTDDTEAYERSIFDTEGDWDVVVVDGRRRVECFKAGLQRVSERGVMLLDDSYRDRYREAFEAAEGLGFRSLKFAGVSPRKFGEDETTVFYRTGNCLGL